MRTIKLIILIFCCFTFVKCENNDFDKLKSLNRTALNLRTLNNFGSFLKSKTEINNIRVCNKDFSNCEENETPFELVLTNSNIPVDSFLQLHEEMLDLGYSRYFKLEDFSLWVKGGAFGEIHGHLVQNNKAMLKVDSFRLNEYYFIEVGDKLDENIYSFQGY